MASLRVSCLQARKATFKTELDRRLTIYDVSLSGLGVEAVPENQSPTFSAIDAQVISEGSEWSLALAATDADGDAISYSISESPDGSSLSDNVFTWTPDFGQAGSYAVTFTATDARGGSTGRYGIRMRGGTR